MDRFRNQLFSGSTFARDQHRAVGRTHDFDHLEELLHFLALPDEIAHPVHFPELALQIGVFFAQAATLESVEHDELQLFHEIFGFQDVIKGAHF